MPLAAARSRPWTAPGRGRLLAARRLDPGLGDGAEVADEVAGRAVRFAPRPGGGQLGQPREPEQPLGHLRLGGEEALAAQPDPLDQPPHEDVGAALLHRRRGFAVELEEGLDPLARLGRDLRALQRRLAGGDHVDLAPPGDRRQPRQVGRAQLDRRPGQRPRRRGRVVRGRRAPAARRSRRAPRAAGRAPPGRRGGRGCRAPPSPPRPARPWLPGRRPARRSPPAGCRSPAGARPRGRPPAPAPARSCSARSAAAARGTAARGRWTARRPAVEPRGTRRPGRARPRLAAPARRAWFGFSAGERREDRPLGRGRVLELVDHQVREAGRRSRRGRPVARARSLLRVRKTSPSVEVAGLGEDAVVGGAELGQFGLGRLGAGLQLVDRRQQAGEQAGRVAADLAGCAAAARRGGRAASPGARPGRGRRRRGRARRPSSARAAAARRSSPRCRSRAPRRGGRAATRPARRRRCAVARVEARTRTRSGPSPRRRAGAEAARQHLGLAGSRGAEQQQRAVAVADARSWASARASMLQR